jgi:Na+/H+ antiporter NhaA
MTNPTRFASTEARSAGLLLAATAAALLWANSPWSASYQGLWATEVGASVGGWGLSMDLGHWVNDGLMALFFFVIGLEVRREFSVGELTSPRRAAIPVIAAVGGLVVPALIYVALAPGGEADRAWGLVIGTDTAFLLGALAVVGPALSPRLRIFLLTLTVIDDIVAVGVIGLVYSDALDVTALAAMAGLGAVLAVLSRYGVTRAAPYLAVGLLLWLATLQAGLHASIAGMLGGLLVAAHEPRRDAVERAARRFLAFRQAPGVQAGRSAHRELVRAVSVNDRLQARLHGIASYLIVPVFAFANAGIDLRGGVLADALTARLTWAVVAGLVLGKLLGIGLAAWAGVRAGAGTLPAGVDMRQVLGGAALSGIGFTVSLLIAGLAFTDPALHDQAVVGVLVAAVLSTLLGWAVFTRTRRKEVPCPHPPRTTSTSILAPTSISTSRRSGDTDRSRPATRRPTGSGSAVGHQHPEHLHAPVQPVVGHLAAAEDLAEVGAEHQAHDPVRVEAGAQPAGRRVVADPLRQRLVVRPELGSEQVRELGVGVADDRREAARSEHVGHLAPRLGEREPDLLLDRALPGHRGHPDRVREHRGEQRAPVRVPPVDRRLGHARPGGDALDGDRGGAALVQEREDRGREPLVEVGLPGPARPGRGHRAS